MKQSIYFTEIPSVYNLLAFLKEKGFPVRTARDYPTMRAWYEAILPKELLACMNYKTREQNEKNANATWLHRGDPTANGRRKEMAERMQGAKKSDIRPESILADMKARIAGTLTRETDTQDEQLLSDILLQEADCIPFEAENANRVTYLRHMRYYIQKDIPYALAVAILLLLLGKYAGEIFQLMLADRGNDKGDQSLNAAILAYENGNYKIARELFENLERSSQTVDAEKGRALYYLGEMERTGATDRADSTKAYRLYNRAFALSRMTDGEACYRLFDMSYHGDGLKAANYEEAGSYLKQACTLKNREAQLAMASFLSVGEKNLKIKRDMEKARELYREGAAREDAAFLYGLGVLEASEGRNKEAEDAFLRASRAGNREAAYRLDQLRLAMENHLPKPAKRTKKTAGEALPVRIIAANADNAYVHSFAESADSYLSGSGEAFKHMEIGAETDTLLQEVLLIANGVPEKEAEWIFLLFDDDDEKNYADAQHIVACLNQCTSHTALRRWLMKSVIIFLRTTAPESLSALRVNRLNALYDSARESGEPAACYRIRTCEETRDASLYLLSRLPLFMTGRGIGRTGGGNIFLWGDGNLAERLIRDILAVFPYKNLYREKVRIAIAAKDADKVRAQITEYAPALLEQEARGARMADLHFYPETDEDILRILDEASEDKQDPVLEALMETDYFILCSNDDMRNADMALRLREKLIRRTLSGKNEPEIAAYIKSNVLSECLSDAGTQSATNRMWHSHYRILAFGAPNMLYSYRNLCKSRVEERAYQMHLSYYGAKTEDIWQAFGDYWSRYYNRDSSVMSALGTIYAAAAAGIRLKDMLGYGTEAETTLSEEYKVWLSNPANLDLAARLEHERWRYLLYTRGWHQATLSQAERYIQAGNPSHQLHIAKLHPYLCAWDELDRLGERFNRMMRTLVPDYKDRDIKAADYVMVEKGAELL